MMREWGRFALALAPALLVSAASAKVPPTGYLAPGQFDILAVLPPAPTAGDARDQADRAIFRATRALEGTPRWALAASDAETGDGPALKDFACAMGIEATPDEVPRLLAMTASVLTDITPATRTAKDHFRRLRPYHVDPGPTCRDTADLGNSFDFPSGHTTYGWAWATLLAQALPDRASAILARGRAFGESRYICGMHNYSAVEAGWFTTSTIIALQGATPRYQADLAGVRDELAALRNPAHAPDPARCAVEQQVLAAQPVATAGS